MNKHLVKVIFEYSDGSGLYLEKWLAFNSIVTEEAKRHGLNPPWQDIKWRTKDNKPSKY